MILCQTRVCSMPQEDIKVIAVTSAGSTQDEKSVLRMTGPIVSVAEVQRLCPIST